MTNPYVQNPYTQQSPQSLNFQTAGSPVPYGQQYGGPPQQHPQGTLILIFFRPVDWVPRLHKEQWGP